MKVSSILKAHLALFLVNALYGANHVVAKDVMSGEMEPNAFIFFRAAGAVLLFWLVKSIRALGRGPVMQVDAPVYTSPRKANAVGPWRLLWQTISIGVSGPRRWRDRSRLRFWYHR